MPQTQSDHTPLRRRCSRQRALRAAAPARLALEKRSASDGRHGSAQGAVCSRKRQRRPPASSGRSGVTWQPLGWVTAGSLHRGCRLLAAMRQAPAQRAPGVPAAATAARQWQTQGSAGVDEASQD